VEEGGPAQIIMACLGNNLGFGFTDHEFSDRPPPQLGDILISCVGPYDFGARLAEDARVLDDYWFVGTTTEEKKFSIEDSDGTLGLSQARAAFESKLDGVFPTTAIAEGEVKTIAHGIASAKPRNDIKVAKPKVLIPIFPGTNGEYDMAAAFERAGAQTEFCVIKDLNYKDIAGSIAEMAAAVKTAQILVFAGGFAGMDEPGGTGKFIAGVFRDKRLVDAVQELLFRDGLILGVSDGFQALIKLGLLPYGKFENMSENSPTLTVNPIGRHVSSIARIRVASNLSPWLSGVKTGDIFHVPVSHGEGRFVATDKEIESLIANGQIAAQFVDKRNNATMVYPHNPFGSMMAVEGITSPCGRILGKTGHSERIGKNLYKNVPGNYDMKIFESGVKYFK